MSGKKSTGNQNVRRRVANPSTTTDEIDSDLDGTLDSGDGTKRVSESQSGQKQSQQKPKTKLQKFLTRFYVTWAMIFGFCGVIYVGHFLVAIILIGLQVLYFVFFFLDDFLVTGFEFVFLFSLFCFIFFNLFCLSLRE